MVDPPYRVKNMMPGMIMLWYGSVATIPSGWHLCDGTAGTPDLVGKFIWGAGVSPPPGISGGTSTHDHDFTGDGHYHSLGPGDDIIDSTPGGNFNKGTSTNPAHGTTDSDAHLPPYHTLCYIMKLPIP